MGSWARPVPPNHKKDMYICLYIYIYIYIKFQVFVHVYICIDSLYSCIGLCVQAKFIYVIT